MNWDLFNLLDFVRAICFIYPIFVALSIPVILTIRLIYWFISNIRTGTGSVIFKSYAKISGITIVCSLILGGISTMYLRTDSMLQHEVALDEFAHDYKSMLEKDLADSEIFGSRWDEEGLFDARIRSKIKATVSSEINTLEKLIEEIPYKTFLRINPWDIEKAYVCKTISIDDEGYEHQARLAKEETTQYAMFIGDQEGPSSMNFVKFIDGRVQVKIPWGYTTSNRGAQRLRLRGAGDLTEYIDFGTAGSLEMEKHAVTKFDGKKLIFRRLYDSQSWDSGTRYIVTMSCKKLLSLDTLALDIRIFAGQEI